MNFVSNIFKGAVNKPGLICLMLIYSFLSFSLNAESESGVKVKNLLISDAHAYEKSEIVSIESLVNKNLFGVKKNPQQRKISKSRKNNPRNIVSKNHKFILSGIFKDIGAKKSTAILKINNMPQAEYKEEQIIIDNIKLVRIRKDDVVLSDNGVQKIIKMF